MLGLRPWLAFLRRALAFFFCVRFDMTRNLPVSRVPAPARAKFAAFAQLWSSCGSEVFGGFCA